MFSWGSFYLAYNNQAVEPLGEAVSNTELFRRLSRIMGIDDPFFFRCDEQMAQDCIDWASPLMGGATFEDIKRNGFVRLAIGSPDSHAPHRHGNFPTPSGKCEFKSSLAANGDFVSPLYRQGYEGRQPGTPVDPLPNYTPPNESAASAPELAEKYPLSLISPKSHSFLNSQYWNFPRQLAHAGGHQVQMNPTDAGRRRIQSGGTVKVFNGRGSFRAIVIVTDDVLEGTVVAPVGFWNANGSGTVHSVTSPAFNDLGRAPTYSDALVEVAVSG
jgi:anaerobic selenocysteine-containing dehydrogenase